MDWNRAMNLPGYSVSLRHNRTITEEWLDTYYSVLYVEVVIERELLNLLLGVYFSTFQIIIIMLSTFWLSSFLICDRINIGVVSVTVGVSDHFYWFSLSVHTGFGVGTLRSIQRIQKRSAIHWLYACECC